MGAPVSWNLIPYIATSSTDAEALPVTEGRAVISLVTGGAETRTLADPQEPGQRMTLGFQTDGGDCVITAASPVNQTGNTVMTFADAGDALELVAIEDGADREWRIIGNDGVALS